MLRKFGRDFVIYGFSSTLSSLIGIILVPLYTRYFSVEEFGVQDLILVIVTFTAALGMLQLESAVGRYYFAEKDEQRRATMISTAFWTILAFSLFFFIILSLFASYISESLFGAATYNYVLIIAALKIPIANLSSLFTVIMRFKRKAVHYLLFQLVNVVITITTSLILIAYYETGIMGAFIGILSGWLVITVSMGFYLRSYLKPVWDVVILKKMMRYSLPLLPSVVGNKVDSYMSRFIMLGYLSITDVGVYAVALKVASVFHLIGGAFRMTWPPFFWDTYENNPNHRSIFSKLHQHITIIVIGLVVVVSLFSDEVIAIFATPEYYDATKLVGMLVLSAGISSMVIKITGVGPGITKKTEYNTIIFFIGTAVNISLLFTLVPNIGLMGVPISLLLSTLVRLAISWYNSEKLYYIGFKKLPATIAIIFAILLIIITIFFQLPLFVKLLISSSLIIGGVVVYRNELKEIISLK